MKKIENHRIHQGDNLTIEYKGLSLLFQTVIRFILSLYER